MVAGSSRDSSLRFASGALLLGVALLIVGSVAVIPLDGVDSANRPAWVIAHLLLVLGGAAILLGLPGIYLRQSSEAGPLGLIGLGLATARAAVFPRGAGYLMAAGGLLALPTMVINVAPVVALLRKSWPSPPSRGSRSAC